ncbi:MAG: 6,7-dimethyl-8-ribityllumazine synthase [Planctomycetes bacterium]|nr:6,7-dimethyl-8-ribityllumazine synthase [Planctomycetota bacterium]
MREFTGSLDGQGLTFALVVSRFNEVVTGRLLAGAIDCLVRHGVRDADLTVVRVPGAFEIPLAAKAAAESGRFRGVVCLGALVRGETPHFDYLSSAVAKALAEVGLSTGVPASFGVLTTDTLDQALDRAGGKAGNKGAEAALAVLEMVRLLERLAGGG